MSNFWGDLFFLSNSIAKLDQNELNNFYLDPKANDTITKLKPCYTHKFEDNEQARTECILNNLLMSSCLDKTLEMQKCAEKYKKETANYCGKYLFEIFNCIEGEIDYLNIVSKNS